MNTESWKDEYEKLFLSIESNTIKNAFSLKANHIPQKLYRYRTVNEDSLACLKNNQIWCTTLDSYNDPYEGYMYLNHPSSYRNEMLNIVDKVKASEAQRLSVRNAQDVKELAIALFTDDTNNQNVFEKKYNDGNEVTKNKNIDQIKDVQTNTKICSFSEIKPFNEDTYYNKANRLMWAHYGDNHKGFCLEYSTTNREFDFYPVLYASKLLDITPFFIQQQNGEQTTALLPFYTPMKKEDVWSYEKEWRYILVDTAKIKHKNLQDLIPTAIYLGARINPDVKDSIIEIANNNHITIFQVEMDSKEYKLNTSEL